MDLLTHLQLRGLEPTKVSFGSKSPSFPLPVRFPRQLSGHPRTGCSCRFVLTSEFRPAVCITQSSIKHCASRGAGSPAILRFHTTDRSSDNLPLIVDPCMSEPGGQYPQR